MLRKENELILEKWEERIYKIIGEKKTNDELYELCMYKNVKKTYNGNCSQAVEENSQKNIDNNWNKCERQKEIEGTTKFWSSKFTKKNV